MRFDRDTFNKARIIYPALSRDDGQKREVLARELHIPEQTARAMIYAIENMDIISGAAEQIDTNHTNTELIIADCHIPFHDDIAIDKILDYAAGHHNITNVSLQGDILDMYKSSFFKKDPTKGVSIVTELQTARGVLEKIRSAFPDAGIVYLEGNHEQRFMDCLDGKAPDYHELLEGLLEVKLGLPELGIKYVNKYYKLGRLWHLHGHERKGGWGVINVCRVMMDRVMDNFVTAHFHTTQEYVTKKIDGSIIGGWSIGHTATDQAFEYNPLNKWNQGFGIVEYADDGEFVFHNKKICNGKIY